MNNTVVLIKPDAFERNLVGYIISQIEQRFQITQARIEHMNTYLISRHYKDHITKDYYNTLHNFMFSGPTLALLLFGEDVVVKMTELRNEIRMHLQYKNPRNLIHSSDLENVSYELDLWFPEQ